MEANSVRLVAMEIENIKNVKYGRLDFAKSKNGSILGIYGQNGSGKTVVVDCMLLLKQLFSGKLIPSNFYYYINSQSEKAQVKYCFDIKSDHGESYAEYKVQLSKNGEHSFCISREKLSVKNYLVDKKTKLTPVFEYTKGEKEFFRPLKYYNYFEKNIDNMISLGVAQQATENFNDENEKPEVSSFLFSKKAQDIFAKAKGEAYKIFYFISIL